MNTVLKKKILLIPYPAQGHVTPMLKLASLLSIFGFELIIITPDFIHRRISSQINDDISSLSICDGLDEETPRDFFAIETAMEKNMPFYLEQLILKFENGGGVGCMVVDLLASWAIDVGRRRGIPVAGFWPAMHATYRLVAAIPHLIRLGVISENGTPRSQNASICLSPNDPPLSASDLPWLIGSSTARISRFKFWKRTLQRSKTLPWILMNSFPEESQMKSRQTTMSSVYSSSQQVLEIGPLIMQAPTISNASFWEEDMSCMDWLDQQEMGSVVYVSFGSWVSPIGDTKVMSLALALEATKRPFLWVLGPARRKGLPSEYAERTALQGKVVSWAPQMEVLKHPAVGCYFTHCGWNSTVEGIQCKKPFLCYPIAGDQFVNCAYIVDEWKIGVKVEGFGGEELENGLRKVMEDEEVGKRIEELNERSFGKEGSSKAMANLSMFIQDLKSTHLICDSMLGI